jgi:signal transduction histidine kinase
MHTDDILDLAKMESGKVSLVMEECSLADSMREAMAMFVHASQTKEVKMNLQIERSCPKIVLTDKVRGSSGITSHHSTCARSPRTHLLPCIVWSVSCSPI